MSQFGGSAAINGFLYQILHHLGWLTEVRLSGTLDGQEVKDACLILEPRDGGDARAHASSVYLVEQYKTRTMGTWSLTDLTAVLRDLRKTVPDLRPGHARYRFVTDGRAGKLGAFESFVARLSAVEGPNDLDNRTKHKFTNTHYLCDREFLDHVAETTRNEDAGSTTAEEREIVFHLLRRFEMKFEVGNAEIVGTVEARLRPHVCNLGDEQGVRHRLVAALMESLGAGEAKLDEARLDTMFQSAGLSPNRLRNASKLARKLEEGMHRRSAYLKYRRENDVRNVPDWPETKPVLLIAGESGAGKSWQLARLMEECVAEGDVVVFVRGAGTAEDILTRAAREMWQVGLGETSDKTLQAISNFFREDAFQLQSPLYTIAVDDVQNVDVARDLVRRDWASLDARLALTVPLTLARAIISSECDEIRLHGVGDFSIDELDDLLRMSGHRWGDLPDDLKRLLRKPVLAGMFLELSVSSFRDAPQSEYEIFQAFWDRIDARCNAGDKGIVEALATLALEGKSYPLPREGWGEIGLAKESLAALEAAGWLSCLEHGEVEFAHERLLNWAAAQSLSRRFVRGRLSVDELFARMTGTSGSGGPDTLGRFGYVPMDMLWLLSAESSNLATVCQLAGMLESHPILGGHHFYTKLLPTLGQRAVPLLLRRLETITEGSSGDYRVGLLGDAFAMLARQESVDVRSDIDQLLHSWSWDRQSVAVKALAATPDPGHMDRLWEIHQQRLDARDHHAGRRFERGHETTFSALRIGVGQQPEWLRDRILNSDPGRERVSEFGYLLSGLDHPRADNIWRDVRDVLMENSGKTNPRSVLYCIARFADHGRKKYVVEHLSRSGEIVSGAALMALAVLDPQEAIERIVDVDDKQMLFRAEWLPLLLRADSELTRQRIRELADSDSRGHRLIEDYFGKRPADFDRETLGLVLKTREKQLRDHFDVVTTQDVPWPLYPLRFLGRMCCPALLSRLQEEAGGHLESAVTALACSRLRDNHRTRDPVLEAARRTLVLFAGKGIVDLVNRELESEHYWVRHGGLNGALMRGDEGTIQRLAAIARRPMPPGSGGGSDSYARQEFYEATIGLAALGADEILVEIFSNPEFANVPLRLADFRAHRGPMAKSLTEFAVHTMRCAESSEGTLRCSLVIAWLSGDAGLIPDVRAVLNRVEPDSRNALHACIALDALGDRTADFARMAEWLAATKENERQGLAALIRLGRDGVDGLRRWLNRAGNAEGMEHREAVVRALYAHTESRKDAIAAAAESCLMNRVSFHPLYEIAAESEDQTVRERILEEAFSEDSVMVNAPLDAIRGLAKFDANRAVEAVELGLSNHPKIERELCLLLVRLAPESAAERLIDTAIALERDSLSDAVGRALRRLDPNAVAEVVVGRLGGTDAERRVVCRVAGWLPVREIAEALKHIADRESQMAVRRAAMDALYRHREEEAIGGLFSEFQAEHCTARRWAFFVSILETADPHLLTDRDDSLWLGRILTKDVPYSFAHYAGGVLEKRKRNES